MARRRPTSREEQLAIGQIRGQRVLGAAAVYRVLDLDGDVVLVEVLSAPGLAAGTRHRLTRAAVCAMSSVDGYDRSV